MKSEKGREVLRKKAGRGKKKTRGGPIGWSTMFRGEKRLKNKAKKK